MRKTSYLVAVVALLFAAQPLSAQNAFAKKDTSQEAPLFPVAPFIAEPGYDSIYPSVAGDFLVYGKRQGGVFDVVRVSRQSPAGSSYKINPMSKINKDIRYGVAVEDGSIGYVSNRVGPISAWMWQGKGEGHVAIGNLAVYRGGLAPYHLNASRNGQVWCFDSTFEKVRYNQMLNEFEKFPHHELMGQQWRSYNSDHFRYKQGYQATETGNENKLDPPALFVYSRKTAQMVMIPNAFNGAISPDGKRIVFVRETDGNYDLWMQEIDGSELVQLTTSKYGDFEPAWSPDGKKLAFISNRDAKGDVRATSVYMLDLSSNRITRLTNGHGVTDGGPAWLDNRSVVFHSDRDLKKPQQGTSSTWNVWKLSLD